MFLLSLSISFSVFLTLSVSVCMRFVVIWGVGEVSSWFRSQLRMSQGWIYTCVCMSIISREALKWRLYFMDERVGWLSVPSCTGIYQLIWVVGDWKGAGSRRWKKRLWSMASFLWQRPEVTHCFTKTFAQHANIQPNKKTTIHCNGCGWVVLMCSETIPNRLQFLSFMASAIAQLIMDFF